MDRSSHLSHRAASLLGLVCLLLALVATTPAAPAAAAITPAIALDPGRGPCSTRPIVHGADFPALTQVLIFSERTNPPGEKASQPIAEAIVDRYGIFTATMLVINGDCIDLDGRTPDGTAYTITAIVPGDAQARATFTIDRTPSPEGQCFTETGQCIRGRFLEYWAQNGGLARNGFPLTGERRETLEDGKEYTVQYFERVRLELHPENAPPYDVLLGQFGRRVLSAAYARIRDHKGYEQATAPVGPIAGQTFFAATGHNLGGRFLEFWQQNGGLAQFGYPLTEERWDTLEDGKLYRTQYFERGRLELHPENAAPYDVLLGQFGRQILAENALLSGTFAQLYLSSPGVRERLGSPTGPAVEAPGAAQTFQRGLMLWRGDQRWIYVLSGYPAPSGTVLQQTIGRIYFIDAWTEGEPAGGGPAQTEPGAFVPKRGFFKVWQQHEHVREALGYAATPDETGYTIRVQEFGGGLLITGDTPAGRFIYAIYVQRTSNSGAPIITYQGAWTERVGPGR